jgi:hypothetical protein
MRVQFAGTGDATGARWVFGLSTLGGAGWSAASCAHVLGTCGTGGSSSVVGAEGSMIGVGVGCMMGICIVGYTRGCGGCTRIMG